jgi:glycyl-tRNA synthetase
MSDVKLEDIVSLCKRRGFIFQGSEIYGGLAGTWDYGPLGVALKRNITNLWWKTFVEDRDDMYGLDTTILMNPKVWEASGHVATFNDPLIEDVKTKKRYRLDHLLEDNNTNPEGMTLEQMIAVVKEKGIKSPDGNTLGAGALFNMMFKTHAGPTDDESSVVYMRPETAQGMFVNFKNVLDSFSPDLPFGIAQMGRNFRNEISPRDFIFRVRELEIMELEYFIDPSNWEAEFEKWLKMSREWFAALGLPEEKVHEHELKEQDRAHYSKRTIDFYYDFPFKKSDEIGGLAYRTDFDLTNHEKYSGKNLKYIPKTGGEAFVPHVIEPTYGIDRNVLAVLSQAYTEDEVNGEKRIFLKFPTHLAPVKIAVLPLAKNKPDLVAKAREIYNTLKKEFGNVMWVDTGNIGKNYRKMDEIGVPNCITVDFNTLEGTTKDTVTVRNRDTTEQQRVKIDELDKVLK